MRREVMLRILKKIAIALLILIIAAIVAGWW